MGSLEFTIHLSFTSKKLLKSARSGSPLGAFVLLALTQRERSVDLEEKAQSRAQIAASSWLRSQNLSVLNLLQNQAELAGLEKTKSPETGKLFLKIFFD